MSKKRKRTLSPERLAKMQAGKRRAREARKRTKMLADSGLSSGETIGYTQRQLDEAKRYKH